MRHEGVRVVVGILSDTHDKVEATRMALATLGHGGAEFYIHCGDVGGEQILDLLAGLPCAFVWGNNDWDRTSLLRYAEQLGLNCYGNQADLELDGKRIVVMHGDHESAKRKALESQEYDYLLHGHTHMREDRRVGRTRVINPGALHRAREKTVATLNLSTDLLRFVAVNI